MNHADVDKTLCMRAGATFCTF